MDIFEQASRSSLRFPSALGLLATEQLWNIPLQSKNPQTITLDNLAQAVNKQLKNSGEQSFVSTGDNPIAKQLELKLDILKHIIAVRLEHEANAAKAEARRAERDRLIEILGDKQDEALRTQTPEELAKRIAELS